MRLEFGHGSGLVTALADDGSANRTTEGVLLSLHRPSTVETRGHHLDSFGRRAERVVRIGRDA